ncbi:aldose epimerase family protein [Bombella pollinis]|uniref:Aldose 1-epimerase n=1 Tax=Bombella pollinis TaxID=2967337 RepID=A0ABT3WTD2_9PROT|nr:aldose epimerase family protein [Bombella pollinis]MCX5620126.1 galactose mutarotase [Bombella pollinis]
MPRFLKSRGWLLSASALAASVALSGMAVAHPKVSVQDWGHLSDKQKVKAVTLSNDNGVTVTLLTYGATIHKMDVPDKNGHLGNVVLGFPNIGEYERNNGDPRFGAVLGRVANRITNGSFTLEGKTYHTLTNEGTNTLHGGPNSFAQKLWTIERKGVDADGAYVEFKVVSPDGDQGFPGTLTTHAIYRLRSDNTLSLHFQATTDAPTVVNLSTHNYWNLNGEGSGAVDDEIVQMYADHYLKTDAQSIPTGELAAVDGTPFDFRQPRRVGDGLRQPHPQMLPQTGYDKCMVLNGPSKAGDVERVVARVTDPHSGRVMEVSTNMPGMQFYSSNHIYGTYYGLAGKTYRQGDALAFEPEFFPNSPNTPSFPSIELKPGQTYDYSMSFRFSHQ